MKIYKTGMVGFGFIGKVHAAGEAHFAVYDGYFAVVAVVQQLVI